MRVLVACEYSGRTREAFRRLGHDAWSCDLLPAEDNSKHHHQCDVRDVLRDHWDLMIAHPECTFLCASGMHWTTRGHRDPALTENAIEFVKTLMNAPIGRIAIENPVGILSKRVRKPDQIIQPYEYGDDASKRTCLWLKNLSLSYVRPNISNQDGYVAEEHYLISAGALTASGKTNPYLAGVIRPTVVKTSSPHQPTAGKIGRALIKGGLKQWHCNGVAL